MCKYFYWNNYRCVLEYIRKKYNYHIKTDFQDILLLVKLNYNANQVRENIKSIIVQVLCSLGEDLKSGVYRTEAWENTAYQLEVG